MKITETNNRWFWFCIGFAVVAAALLIWSNTTTEPSYDGKSLSYWLDKWSQNYNDRSDPAAHAIVAIGSNAVPTLIRRIEKRPSRIELQFSRLISRLYPNQQTPINSDIEEAVTAAEAINLLGTNARSAFPALTNLWLRRANLVSSGIALAGVGHEGVQILIRELTNSDWRVVHAAALGLAEAQSDWDIVVPALTRVLKSSGQSQSDFLVRGQAGDALVRLHKQPEKVVATFCELLTNSSPAIRVHGAVLLSQFGTDAKPAIPALHRACADSNERVRVEATNALENLTRATN